MEIVGFCKIRSNPTTGTSPAPIKEFTEQPCRCLEINDSGDVLCVNPKGTALATFDACDVESSFRCTFLGDFICPPDLNFSDRLLYTAKLTTRKGGYQPVLRDMVIIASLHKNKFCDSFLWQNQ